MKFKLSILYSWFIRSVTYFLPNHPLFMRLRGWLYSFMMKRCGKNFQVTSSAILNSLSGMEVGDHVYIAHNTVLIGIQIKIDSEVLIGPNCVISGGNHVFKNGSFRFAASVPQPVLIGRGSWVAGNCTLTAGSILPERSILASGAVLSSKFEEQDALYGGTPARFIKKLMHND